MDLKKTLLVMVALTYTLVFAGEEGSEKVALTVEVEGFSSNQGLLRLALFRSPEGWPRDPAKAVTTASVAISLPLTKVVLEGIEPGTYAVSVFQDENSNGKLDRNFLGIPSEPYGFSNDARASFGPPKFDKASFSLLSDKAIRIHIK